MLSSPKVTTGLFMAVAVFLICVMLLQNQPAMKVLQRCVLEQRPRIEAKENSLEGASSNFLDGCKHVYLDVGTNIGVQIRKLYERNLYPEAKIHPIFDKYLRRQQALMDQICAVGFEPNPSHALQLKRLEDFYRGCGWNVKIFTMSGVSDHEGHATFFSDNALRNFEWGGTIWGEGEAKEGDVKLIRLAKFITDIVATRKTSEKGYVLMKLDVEGSELEVLPDMLYERSFKFIDGLMVEYHTTKDAKRTKAIKKLAIVVRNLIEMWNLIDDDHKIDYIDHDDESYHSANFSLPASCPPP